MIEEDQRGEKISGEGEEDCSQFIFIFYKGLTLENIALSDVVSTKGVLLHRNYYCFLNWNYAYALVLGNAQTNRIIHGTIERTCFLCPCIWFC